MSAADAKCFECGRRAARPRSAGLCAVCLGLKERPRSPRPLTGAERIALFMDVLEENARILAMPDLTAEERRLYGELSENAYARLTEAHAAVESDARGGA